MGRPIRLDSADTWHHVMNRGASRQPVFRDDLDRLEFERLLGEATERFGVVIHAERATSGGGPGSERSVGRGAAG